MYYWYIPKSLTKENERAIIWIEIKPTKHNKEYLKNRGLFSDDAQLIFDIYSEIMSGRIFGIPQNDPSTPLLLKILSGLKY